MSRRLGLGQGNLTLRDPAGERGENREKHAKREWQLRSTGVHFKCRVENGLGVIFDNRTAKPGETIKATPYPYRNPSFQGVAGHKGHLFAPQSDQTPQIMRKTTRGQKQGGGGGGMTREPKAL